MTFCTISVSKNSSISAKGISELRNSEKSSRRKAEIVRVRGSQASNKSTGLMANHFGKFGPQIGHDDEDSISSSSSSIAADKIKRHQHSRGDIRIGIESRLADEKSETIRVKLDESYFAKEKAAICNFVANARQRLTSIRMFNPAKNETIRETEQTWNESEKYTLDSLNEIRGNIDEQFQWTRPEDSRQIWSSKLQYFLAITSYSIGLGNVIRFPILVQKNGGLAFIITFVILLIVEGIPLFYLELAVGQRMRKAAISCWNLVSPFAAGIGIASAAVSFIIGLYYNTMVAWTLIYLWDSSNSSNSTNLPYSRCHKLDQASSSGQTLATFTSTNKHTGISKQANGFIQATAGIQPTNSSNNECQTAGPWQYYWYRDTLNASEDVNTWTNFNWPIFFSLVIAWLLSYFCLARGLSSSKRVVYVASTFPYVILTIFFFKAMSLEGMSDGVYYFFAPEWSKLADPYVWLQSAAQVFFSLGLGFGGLIALSSYNPVNNNCHRDAVKVSLINFFTSIYAGIVIFAILGYKARISYDKCSVERQQMIDFYISDYNLKVIEYGSVFNNKIEAPSKINNMDPTAGLPKQSNSKPSNQATNAKLASGNGIDNIGSMRVDEMLNSSANEDSDDDDDDYKYDSQDAIDSIRNLDRQIESSLTEKYDYGDSDTEFILNASSMISEEDLEKIISQIPGLPQCDIRDELDEATQGPGLVFVVIAEAMSHFSNARSWAIIFFLMLLTLGLDSQLGNLEGLLSSISDLNLRDSMSRQVVTGLICLVSLAISTVMFAHGAGSYMFAIFDEYAASFSLVLIALFELVAISYIYGLKRFCDDCELMTGRRPSFIIMFSWRYLSPILLIVTIFATAREFATTLNYEAWVDGHVEIKPWPAWCITFGAILIVVCIIWIPGIAILKIFGITLIPEENLNQCWFPAEELREFHDIQEEHKITSMERILLGFRSDDD